ncbi:hypothetical protein SDJN02_02647, partial [Cucurbita argyrosperma subsp. argyrosperma]
MDAFLGRTPNSKASIRTARNPPKRLEGFKAASKLKENGERTKPGFNFHGILSSSIVHKDSSIKDIYRQSGALGNSYRLLIL